MGRPSLYYNVYASNVAPVNINDPRNIIATRTKRTSLDVPQSERTKYFAVTAIDRYGKESSPAQSNNNANEENAIRQGLIRNNGNTVALPPIPSTLDIEYILIESVANNIITSKKYEKNLNINNIPDGMYIIRSLSKKGKSHRLGWMFIKRREI